MIQKFPPSPPFFFILLTHRLKPPPSPGTRPQNAIMKIIYRWNRGLEEGGGEGGRGKEHWAFDIDDEFFIAFLSLNLPDGRLRYLWLVLNNKKSYVCMYCMYMLT